MRNRTMLVTFGIIGLLVLAVFIASYIFLGGKIAKTSLLFFGIASVVIFWAFATSKGFEKQEKITFRTILFLAIFGLGSMPVFQSLLTGIPVEELTSYDIVVTLNGLAGLIIGSLGFYLVEYSTKKLKTSS